MENKVKEIIGNIWDFHDAGNWIVITTNGYVRKDGKAVMGRGVALQAAQRFPSLPFELGVKIGLRGNIPYLFPDYRIVTLPVKHMWKDGAELRLIEDSVIFMSVVISSSMPKLEAVYLPRPGCGNGGLDWKDVKPILEKYLDNRFVIVEINNSSSIVIESSD